MEAHHDSLPETLEPYQHQHLIAHNEILEDLWNAYRAGQLPHGMLFAGRQGIGKATTAFALARLILSYPDSTQAPALQDAPIDPKQQSLIASGAHTSLKHLTRMVKDDGKGFKTGIAVDDIRKIGHFLSMSADGGLARIVIIDPADDMNVNAANALLKSLEEPPKNTVMILIAHRLGRLLPTIRSRCRVVRFAELSDTDLVQLLIERGYTRDDAAALAKLAEGSLREAIIHDQFGGMDIAQALNAILDDQAFTYDSADKLAAAVSARGADVQFDIFNQLIEQRIVSAAHHQAMQGQRYKAVAMAQLQSDFQERRSKAMGLNLDKHLYATNALRMVHAALR